jgi:hypothetical protein
VDCEPRKWSLVPQDIAMTMAIRSPTHRPTLERRPFIRRTSVDSVAVERKTGHSLSKKVILFGRARDEIVNDVEHRMANTAGTRGAPPEARRERDAF